MSRKGKPISARLKSAEIEEIAMNLSGTIVFSSGKAGDYDIWKLNLDSGELSQLTTGTHLNECPKWSPDGKQIVFVSNRANGIPELWLMDEDGNNQRALTSANKYHNEPSWSPDGTKIVFAGNYEEGDNIDIYTIELAHPDKPERLISYPGWDAGPSWSPDGECVAFSSSRAGNEDVWEYRLSDDSWTQLTFHGARDFAPVYSPDGSQIAFISERDELIDDDTSRGDADVWVMNRDGSDLRKITENSGSDRFAAWSPDGKYIVCCSAKFAKKAGRLSIIDVEKGKAVDFSYDRKDLEAEIDASADRRSLIHWLLPAVVRRAGYPDTFFGSEKYPDWKA